MKLTELDNFYIGLDAKVVKQYCKNHRQCTGCKFYKKKECIVGYPHTWIIPIPKKKPILKMKYTPKKEQIPKHQPPKSVDVFL